MRITSTSALSDELCSGFFPCGLIKLLGHQPFQGAPSMDSCVCFCAAKNSLCLLSAKDRGGASQKVENTTPQTRMGHPHQPLILLRTPHLLLGSTLVRVVPPGSRPNGRGFLSNVSGLAKPFNRQRFKFCSLGIYTRISK